MSEETAAADARPDRPASLGRAGGVLLDAAFVAGSVALVAVMATDFVGVISRHLGVPLVGAIEIIQGFIVFAISAGMIAVTLVGGHATVHLVTERLPPVWRARLQRVADALGFAVFAALAVGDTWLLVDTWTWNERTDLVGVPFLPLRLVWAVTMIVVALLFLVRLVRGAPPAGTAGGH